MNQLNMRQVIYRMLRDTTLVLNTKTVDEAEAFIHMCKELYIEDDSKDALTGEDYFEIYKEELCFTLESGVVEYCNKKYFEEDEKEYKIVTLKEIDVLY